MKRIQLNHRIASGLHSFKISVIALFLALLCGGIFISFSGYSPLMIYKGIFIDTFSNKKGVMLALSQATPLMFSGVAFAIAYQVKLINLGAEGQLYMGALISALVGAYLTGFSSFLHITIAFAAGLIAGGCAGLFIGFLKIRFGAREVTTSIMLNEIIILFCSYICNGPLRAKSSIFPQTEEILETAKLPKLVPRTQLTVAIFVIIIIAVLLEILLKKTTLGYAMQVTGQKLTAARAAGIHVSRIFLFTIFLSGGIAGLGGAAMALGVNYRFIEGFSANYGFGGISVAALAAYDPLAAIFSAVIFGILKAGAMTLNRTTSVPVEFVGVIQALVVVFVAAPRMISMLLAGGNKLTGLVSRFIPLTVGKGGAHR